MATTPVSIISVADVKARLQQHYASADGQKELAEGSCFKRVMFLCDEKEREATGLLRQWCIRTKTLAKFIFVPDAESVHERGLTKRAIEYKADFVVVTSRGVFKELGGFYKDGSQDVWKGSVLAVGTTEFSQPVLVLSSMLGKDGRRKEYTMPEFCWELEVYLGKVYKYKGEYGYRITIVRDVQQLAEAQVQAELSYVIAVDIETNLNNMITSIAFTFVDKEGRIGETYVLDWTVADRFEQTYLACKYILERTEAVKCYHNGCFDSFMLMRWRIGSYNWWLDTEYMWHAWEAECKKSLAYVASIALPDYTYWKAESGTNMLMYNGKDTVNTARTLLWLMENMPDWAWRNYAQMVPMFLPTVISNLEGFAVDQDRLNGARQIAERVVEDTVEEIRLLLGLDTVEAAKQVIGSPKKLAHVMYRVLGPVFGWSRPVTSKAKKQARDTGKLPSGTDVTSLKQLSLLHPYAARITEKLLAYRRQAKALSTYYDAKLYGESQRLLYSLQLDGTKTGRFGCSASSLRYIAGSGAKGQVREADKKNYGSQIQNSPAYYKIALCADLGYVIYNIDKSKSEAHCVALISGDKKFREAIQDTLEDFYLKLALWFFGIETGDKEHPIRQVTKKINHATSYCMGWETFLDQVGIVALYNYMELVGWKGSKEPKVFITYLLDSLFHGTFPGIKKWWKRTVVELFNTGGYLTTPDGAVRHFFKVPKSPNGIDPSAVAHQPQRLSVVTLNRNMAQVFYEVQIPSAFKLRLKGQVHDSLVMQVVEGPEGERLVYKARAIMERPYETSLGSLAIPVDVEGPSRHWKEPKKAKPKVEDMYEVELAAGGE
jgi:DNA polymerase I-like protein with 3'-5' exonuclease and polymerase domains